MQNKSATFHPEHLKKSHVDKGKYDAKMVGDDLQKIVDAVRNGDIVLITRRIADMEEASDGSGAASQLVVLEWKFPHGKPTKTVAA